MNLVLIGQRGCGKTTLGRMTAAGLGVDFADTDEMIEEREGKDIASIFEEHGEEAFRSMETAVLASLAGRSQSIVAVGGGAPCSGKNRALISSLGKVVWLKASSQAVVERLRHDPRPPLTSLPLEQEVEALMRGRREHYALAADFSVET
ncbi:MAG: shikimate kinase, partial [Pseudomonadota bacterium]